ncbi:MAG: 3-deoxy-manno-octulosonate cytidylyltransferase [Phycisphaerae bacterium]
MQTIAIIPARYASTRLPGKPLLADTGKPLIRHVVEAVSRAPGLDRVVTATDDERILNAVRSFGAEAVMTSPDCRTGTDRLAQAAKTLELQDGDLVVNVQGDEPEIPPQCIERLIDLMGEASADMATLATPLPADQAGDPNRVKVVLDARGRAMYFSRARIPHDRDNTGDVPCLLHLGLYAYHVSFLHTYANLPSTPAESAEKLEQLRALEHGYTIAVAVVDYDGAGIDTPEDYERFVRRTPGG